MHYAWEGTPVRNRGEPQDRARELLGHPARDPIAPPSSPRRPNARSEACNRRRGRRQASTETRGVITQASVPVPERGDTSSRKSSPNRVGRDSSSRRAELPGPAVAPTANCTQAVLPGSVLGSRRANPAPHLPPPRARRELKRAGERLETGLDDTNPERTELTWKAAPTSRTSHLRLESPSRICSG